MCLHAVARFFTIKAFFPPFSHKKRRRMVGEKHAFPQPYNNETECERKNAFPSHGSLPLQSPYLPPPVRKKKKL